MRAAIFSPLLVVLCGACGAATENAVGGTAPTVDVQWASFEAPGERFQIDMPGTPATSEQDTPRENGAIHTRLFVVDQESQLGAAFIVTVTSGGRFAASDASADEIYTLARDGALNGMHAELANEGDVNVSGLPGREITMTLNGGQSFVREQLLFSGNKLYSLVVMARADAAARLTPIADHFFASFRLR